MKFIPIYKLSVLLFLVGAIRLTAQQAITINTSNMDLSTAQGDSLMYVINGAGLNRTIQAGGDNIFKPTLPDKGLISIELGFYIETTPDAKTYFIFDIDSTGKIKNHRLRLNDVTTVMDESLYNQYGDFEVYYTNPNNPQAGKKIAQPYVVLDGGITLTPNGDGSFDELRVEGVFKGAKYSLVIMDVGGNVLFQTKNPKDTWNGKGSYNQSLPIGTYNYIMTVNGQEISSPFTIEY